MANIREVAQRAGVSVGTVSKVLNTPEKVSRDTRQRVLSVIEELGFVRNASAHQLKAKRSPFIGLVILDIKNPFFTELARGAEDVASEAGFVVILGNSNDSLDKESRYLRVLEEQRVQGLLITPVAQADAVHLLRLRERGISLVLLGPAPGSTGLCSVEMDNVRGGEMAAAHLFARGHRRIAFVHGPLSIPALAERYLGVKQAALAAGLDPATAVLNVPVADQQAHSGEASVEVLLSGQDRPSAVFCANDLLAWGVMRGLLQRGLSVPDEMALVGYDDIELAESLIPPLTTIRQPTYEMGQVAAELLLDEMQHPKTHKHRRVLYQPELIVRTSSGGGINEYPSEEQVGRLLTRNESD